MYTQNQLFNPEPLICRNRHYVKQYLASPVTIILGILYAVAAILNILSTFFEGSTAVSDSLQIYEVSVSSPSFSNIFNILLSLAFAICFFLIYFCAKSKKENSAINGSASFFKALAVTQLVIYSLLSAIIVLAIAILALVLPRLISQATFYTNQLYDYDMMSPADADMASSVLIVLAVILAIIVTVLLFFSINQLRFASSVKRSLSTPALSAKGAKATGVCNVIFAVLSALGLLIIAISFFVVLYITDSNAFASSGVYINKTTILSMLGIGLISTFISLTHHIYMAKFAFGFSRHIVAAGPDGIYLPMPIPVTSPVQEQPISQPAVLNPATEGTIIDEKQNPTHLSDFEEDPLALIDENNSETYNTESESICCETENIPTTYEESAPVKDVLPKFCPQCGTKTIEGQIFCSNCGTKTR